MEGNGLTLARHDVFCINLKPLVKESKYPESYDAAVPEICVFRECELTDAGS